MYQGPIEAAAVFAGGPPWQSPNLWWPADRRWCVGTDIDLSSSYVAGSEPVVRALLDHDRLEAMPVESSDPIG